MTEVEERYVQHKKGGYDDSLSDRSSIDEFYLLPQHKKDDFDTKSFESHELDEFNSAASTPASQRKIDIVTSTEISVPGTVFANPMARKGGKIERLSDFEGSIDEMWNKASDNSNNNNGKISNNSGQEHIKGRSVHLELSKNKVNFIDIS